MSGAQRRRFAPLLNAKAIEMRARLGDHTRIADLPVEAEEADPRILLAKARVAWLSRRETHFAQRDRSGRLPYLGDPGLDPRPEQLPPSEVQRSVARDLRRLLGTSRALGVPALLIDYPWSSAAEANAAIRTTAEQLGVPLVHTLELYKRAETRHARHELVVKGAGLHPTGLLYGYIVEAMLPEVERLLGRP